MPINKVCATTKAKNPIKKAMKKKSKEQLPCVGVEAITPAVKIRREIA